MWLKGVYERRYGGLRYVTFLNGRARREEMKEMETVLGMVEKVQGLEWKEEDGMYLAERWKEWSGRKS